jgi:F-type H+-transporting ATPase subunit gamma
MLGRAVSRSRSAAPRQALRGKQSPAAKNSFLDQRGSVREFPGKGALAALGHRKRTVKSIEKITGTMKTVAQAQLSQTAERARNAQQIYTNLTPIYKKLPAQKAEKKLLTVIVTSNRGLCGPLNSALVRESAHDPEWSKSSFVVYGDKGAVNVEKRPGDDGQRVQFSVHPGRQVTFAELCAIADKICAQEYDELKIIFNRFASMSSTVLSHITLPSNKYLTDNAKSVDYEYDESMRNIFKNLHEYHVACALNYAVGHNSASETLSRRNAMDAASKNCKDLQKKLSIEYNKLRQAIITTELIEVTTGAVAVEEMDA